MIVADLTRNLDFTTLTVYEPFIYVGTVKYYTLKTEWETSPDDLFEESGIVKAQQVTRDYLNKYDAQDSLADCESQESSFYFDKPTQQIYIHVEHDYSPLSAVVDYGYAFGLIDQDSAGEYIDDYYYEPVITGGGDISQSADTKGVSQPKGSSSSLTLNNTARYNEHTKLPEGILDFILTESLYHNDVFIYNYADDVLTPIGAFYLEDFDPSLTEITLNLQDKRFS